MVRPFLGKISRWDGGITSDLRLDFEIPKLARMWNWSPSRDRLVQRFGLLELNPDNMGQVLLYTDTTLIPNGQGTPHQHIGLGLYDNGGNIDLDFYDLTGTPSLSTTVTMVNGQSLDNAIVPVLCQCQVIYQSDANNLYAYDIDGATNTQLLAGVTLDQRTYLVAHSQDSYLYVGNGAFLHRVEKYAPGDRRCNIGESVEFVLQIGDCDNNSNIANPGVTTSTVGNLQFLLNEIGFPAGPVDGIFGPLTEAGVLAFNTANNIPAGGPYTGVVSAETSGALNLQCPGTIVERVNIEEFPGQITAMAEYGGYLAVATRECDGHAYVYLYNRQIDAGATLQDVSSFDSKVDMGIGSVQILKVLDGDLIAIMTPMTLSPRANCTVDLMIKKIITRTDFLPQSKATLLAEYKLQSDEGDPFLQQVFYQSYEHNGRLYFTGYINFQHSEPAISGDEGTMAGIFSIDGLGNMFFEYAISDSSGSFTDRPFVSFVPVDDGFLITSLDGAFVTDQGADDVVSGFITKIYNGDEPYNNKQVENVMLSVQGEDTTDRVEIWYREVGDVPDPDAGWVLVCDTDFSTYDSKFLQRITANRLDDGTRFPQSREFQFMVKVYGLKTVVTDFRVIYNMLEFNK